MSECGRTARDLCNQIECARAPECLHNRCPYRLSVKNALSEMGDSFRQFARNGRLGTCGGCPRDSQGNVYPEFCLFTYRDEHLLNATLLAEQFDRRSKETYRHKTDQEKG